MIAVRLRPGPGAFWVARANSRAFHGRSQAAVRASYATVAAPTRSDFSSGCGVCGEGGIAPRPAHLWSGDLDLRGNHRPAVLAVGFTCVSVCALRGTTERGLAAASSARPAIAYQSREPRKRPPLRSQAACCPTIADIRDHCGHSSWFNPGTTSSCRKCRGLQLCCRKPVDYDSYRFGRNASQRGVVRDRW